MIECPYNQQSFNDEDVLSVHDGDDDKYLYDDKDFTNKEWRTK